MLVSREQAEVSPDVLNFTISSDHMNILKQLYNCSDKYERDMLKRCP